MAIDFRSFTDNSNTQTSPVAIDKRWWAMRSAEDQCNAVSGAIGFLQKHQSMRQTQLVTSARLYGNLSLIGINGLSFTRQAATTPGGRDKVTYNVCQSTVDTITSKIAKNKPKPLFLTSGGDYKIQRKAKKLDKFVEGVFYENQAYALGTEIFRDACIWGTGIVHVYKGNGRVMAERVIPGEIFVDEVEAFYGKPRQLHRIKNVDRSVMIDMFPEKASLIRLCKRASPESLGGYENISDVITVRESFHLRSGPDANDGKHIITIDNGRLFAEDWNRDDFPFVFFHWSKRLYGFWGQGLIEQIQNIQLEINKLLWLIQRSMHLAGSFKVLIENGSTIVKSHVNNDIGSLVYYTGTPPQYVTPPIIPPEIYAHLERLKNQAFEQAGISQLSATSKKPDGLDSGKALREYNDIESDRFMTTGQAWEKFFLDWAKQNVTAAKEIYEEEGSYEVQVPGKKFIESIDWKDIDLEDDQYVMKVYPVSSLPSDPAGRLQTVQEYAAAGYMSPRTARRLLDFPDLEQVETLYNSTEDYLHEVLERIVEEGEYTAPEPQDDLALAEELGLEYYAQGKCNGLEEEKLQLIRDFIDQTRLLVKKATTPHPGAMPPPAPGAMPPAPQGAPMPQGIAA